MRGIPRHALRYSDAFLGWTLKIAEVFAHFGCTADLSGTLDARALIAAVHAAGLRQIVTPYAPVGPVADTLARLAPVLANEGITLAHVRRGWDSQFWPHAKNGFFPSKERIPAMLRALMNFPPIKG